MPNKPFTSKEYGDMVLVYGECFGNAAEAMRLYRERYPARRQPVRPQVISEAFKRITENRPIVPESEKVRRDAAASSARSTNNSRATKKKKTEASGVGGSRRPLEIKKVRLSPNFSIEDSRAGYCKWLVSKLNENENFLRDILWSGERIFTNETRLSGANLGYWAKKPMTASQLARFPKPKKYAVRAWGAILDGKIHGPIFVPKRLNGNDYLNTVNDHLVEILNELPLHRLNTIWFQHDRTPPHCTVPVCERLDELFKEKWIGRHGPVPWPAKSHDLTPMDFFLWERIKRDVLKKSCDDNDDMRGRLVRAFDALREQCDRQPELVSEMYADLEKRTRECVAEGPEERAVTMKSEHEEYII